MTSTSEYKRLFRQALLIRRTEEKIIELYPTDKIQSPVHLSIGQEAVAVGVCSVLSVNDLLFTTYRGHAFYLAKGGNLKTFMAELFGKVTGFAKGKAGSMHLAAKEVGFMGCSAVVTSTVPHAVGAALAAKQLGKDQLSITVFGDGATDQGVYHESLNYAALHKLPVIFVCENNGLAVHSSCASRQAYKILEHASAYGLPTAKIEDGYDFVSVRNQFAEIANTVKKNRAPYFVEIITQRYKEHVGVGDDHMVGYRSAKDLEEWQSKDPLITDKATYAEFISEVDAEIDVAVKFAEQSAWPPTKELLTDVC